MKKELGKKIGIWCLAIALFMAHLLFRSIAHAEEIHGEEIDSWEQVFARHGECQIEFPTKPQMIQQSIQLSTLGQRLNYDLYLAPFEDRGIFLLLVATHPLSVEKGNSIVGLEGFLKGLVGHHVENQVIFARWLDFLGHPSLEFLIEGKKSYFRGQALMVGNQLFLMAMEGPLGALDEEIFSRFVQSFQLPSEMADETGS